MTALFEDSRDIRIDLHRAGAEFMVVGGHAVSYYGHPRATKDLDVFIRATEKNAGCVVAALRHFGAPLGQLGISEQDFATPGTVVQLGVATICIDLITEASGITFDEAMHEHGLLCGEADARRVHRPQAL